MPSAARSSNGVADLDARALAGTEEARLIAELAEVAAEIAPVAGGFRPDDAREILEDCGDMSDAECRGFVSTLVAESETLANRATDMFDFMGGRGGRRSRPSPREEIEDFISDRANYFPRLDCAERAFDPAALPGSPADAVT